MNETPLPAQIIGQPKEFGQAVEQASLGIWHYWPAPIAAMISATLAYVMIMKPGVDWSLGIATITNSAGNTEMVSHVTPAFFMHIMNGLGSLFIFSLIFVCIWGSGKLAHHFSSLNDHEKNHIHLLTTQIFSASFTVLIPLYLLCIVLCFLPKEQISIDFSNTDFSVINKLALQYTSYTREAQLFVFSSFIGTAAQFILTYLALKGTTMRNLALRAVLFPLVPVLLMQVFNTGLFLVYR